MTSSAPLSAVSNSPSPSTSPPAKEPKSPWLVRPYTPHDPSSAFPYSPSDFHRQDSTSDLSFYASPRYVTHIDDHAVTLLQQYYASALPRKGRILDFCSSWVSHYPEEVEERAVHSVKEGKREGKNDGSREEEERLEIIGMGMNKAELDANPILAKIVLQDLNELPEIRASAIGSGCLDASTCTVSIDYMTKPLPLLSSIRGLTRPGGSIHLVVSNRCFPTKVVSRWLRIEEEERLQMIGDYLWWAGWRRIEIITICDGRVDGNMGRTGWMGWLGGVRNDPLWVVRGVKVDEERDAVR